METKTMGESRSTKYQYFAAISANLPMLGYGCGIGWVSMAIPLLISNSTPLESGPLTVEEISWIGSILSIGSLTGNFIFGFLVNFFGAKICILLAGIFQGFSWLLLIFGRRVIYLYLSRFCTGLVTGGCQICVSLFVAEIADNAIRGRLGTIYQFGRNFGILFAFSIGSYFNYIKSAMFFLGFTTMFYATFTFLPQTPQHLLQNDKVDEAEISFRYYKGFENRKGSVSHIQQFENLKSVAKEVHLDSKIRSRDIWKARKGFLVATLFPFFNMMSASYVILTYASRIIDSSGTHLSPKVSTIFFAVMQIFGTILSSVLVDILGRKFLLILSMIGCSLGHASMYSYLYLYNNHFDVSYLNWMPIICMGFIVFIAGIGIIPLTLICTLEYFDVKVRPLGLTFGNIANNIITFAIMKMYPVLANDIGLSNCLLIFCITCVVGTFYIIFFIEETKGKELNVVKTDDS